MNKTTLPLGLVMCLALAGCGSGSGDDNKQTNVGSEEQKVTEPETNSTTKPEESKESETEEAEESKETESEEPEKESEEQPLSISVTSLSSTSIVSAASTEVKVAVSDESLVKELSLLVNGEKISTIKTAPWTFDWNAYFWGNSSPTITIEAVDQQDQRHLLNNPFTVEVTNEVIDPLVFNALQAEVRNVDALQLALNPVEGATNYEVKVAFNDEETFVTSDSVNVGLSDLSPGDYSISYRAKNAHDHTGPWSAPAEFSLLNPLAPAALGEPEIEFSEQGYKLTFAAPELEDGFYMQLSVSGYDQLMATTQDGGALVFEGLNPGYMQFEARIVNAYGHISEPAMTLVNLAAPQTPNNVSVNMTPEASQHRVAFSWDGVQNIDSYTLTAINTKTQQSFTESVSGANNIELLLPAGNYRWQMQATDIAGNQSLWSDSWYIDVAQYDVSFPNDGLSFASIETQDKGLVILSSVRNDNWLTKLDAYGRVEWEKTIEKPGSAPLREIHELANGELIASGDIYDGTVRAYFSVSAKFSASGELIWYSEAESTTDTDHIGNMHSAVVWNDQYYRLKVYKPQDGDYDAQIQQLDLSTGEIVKSTALTNPNAAYHNIPEQLMVVNSEQLAIGGVLSSRSGFSSGLYVVKVDTDFQQTHFWEGILNYVELFTTFKLDNQNNLLLFGADHASSDIRIKLDPDLGLLSEVREYDDFDINFEHATYVNEDGSVSGIGYNHSNDEVVEVKLNSKLNYVFANPIAELDLPREPVWVHKSADGTTNIGSKNYSTNTLRVIRKVLN
ncbi:Ig-like domain-containing protein [Pseudoalteromonas rubra]|uniref:Ig-like domain-containing protein n=1 Tax=Pseudoalteromonas rubra TaxID=43658 RepID=UPI000F7AE1D8|nr:Ig-like domain-containing protein [Pseudoalteromonas rubra]